jgi:NagD protein
MSGKKELTFVNCGAEIALYWWLIAYAAFAEHVILRSAVVPRATADIDWTHNFSTKMTQCNLQKKHGRRSMKSGYLIDMDGVIYRGSEPIVGAVDFINGLERKGVPFTFLTNNSQRTRRDISIKLRRMGFRVDDRHVYTCAMATARFLAEQKPNGTAYVIGEGGLLNALHMNGYAVVDRDPDYVVVGEGRTMTFEMIEHATTMVVKGAKLVATNLDPNCPTQEGIRPGCGAITALIEAATGVKAFSVGKPSPIMMRAARKELGLDAARTTMIGDTMETDILGGVQMGYKTILVLSGGSKKEDLARYAYKPDMVIDSIADLILDECSPKEKMALVEA